MEAVYRKLKNTSVVIGLLFIIVLLTKCTTIKYVGDTYTKTDNVEVFYSFNDIEGKYKVFGHIVNSAAADDLIITTDDLKENLIKEAMERGADAIVITNIDIDNTDESKSQKLSASLIKFIE